MGIEYLFKLIEDGFKALLVLIAVLVIIIIILSCQLIFG